MESHELVEEISKYKPDIDLHSLQIKPLSNEQLHAVKKALHSTFTAELEKNIIIPPSIQGLNSGIQNVIKNELEDERLFEYIAEVNSRVVSGIHEIVDTALNEILVAEIEKKKAELEALQKESAIVEKSLSNNETIHQATNVDIATLNPATKQEEVAEKKEPISTEEIKPHHDDSEKASSQNSLNEDMPKRKSTFGSGIRNMLGHLTKQRAPKPKKGQPTEELQPEKKVESKVEKAPEATVVAEPLAEEPIAEFNIPEPPVDEPVVVDQANPAEPEKGPEEEAVVQPKRYVPTNAMSALASAMKSGLGEKVRSHGKSITDLAESRSSDTAAPINPRPVPSTKPRPVTMVEMNTATPPIVKPRPTTSVDDKIFTEADNHNDEVESDAPPPVQPRAVQSPHERPTSHVGVPVLPKIPARPVSHVDEPPPVQPRIKSPQLPERQMSSDRPLSQVDEPPATLPRPRPPHLPERQHSQDRPVSHIEQSTPTDTLAKSPEINEDAPPAVVPRVKSPQLPSRPISDGRPLSTFEANAVPPPLDDEEHVGLTKEEIARNELARKSLARPASSPKPAPIPPSKPLVLKKKENSTSGDDKAIEKKAIEWLNKNLKSHNIELEKLDISDGLTLIYALENQTGESVGKYNKKAMMQVHKMDNIAVSLTFLSKHGVNTSFLTPRDILEGNKSKILTLFTYILKEFP
ncbi:hypothetical protein HDV06_000873 [Boothiomyces sp. JEL0866]|nr:hypothetical protein HDV06_000873 [Boothiomyces sp. JEL0866]